MCRTMQNVVACYVNKTRRSFGSTRTHVVACATSRYLESVWGSHCMASFKPLVKGGAAGAHLETGIDYESFSHHNCN